MKSNNKAFQLIEKGLSANTVAKLDEAQIGVLHKKLVSEVTMVSAGDSSTIQKLKAEKKPFEVYEKQGDLMWIWKKTHSSFNLLKIKDK